MNTTNTEMVCKCGGCPAHRMARGLAPFCRMPAPAPAPMGGYSTFEEAKAAALPGQGVVGVRSGMGHGPLRFIIRGRAVR